MVVREMPFGPTLTDPSKVEDVLRRAQLAIVNPSISMKDLDAFVQLDKAAVDAAKQGKAPLGSTKQLSFSRNPVVVEISGPDLTNLTFLDLPVSLNDYRRPTWLTFGSRHRASSPTDPKRTSGLSRTW